MPKTYTHNGTKFDTETLFGLMGEPIVGMSVAEVNALVRERDAGTATILAKYREDRGLSAPVKKR